MISKKYNKQKKRELWGFDLRIRGKRVRYFDFETRKEAEQAAQHLQRLDREQRFGLASTQMPTLAKLIEQHVGRIDNRAERVRAKRVLGHTPEIMLKNYAGIVPTSETEIARTVQGIEENRSPLCVQNSAES